MSPVHPICALAGISIASCASRGVDATPGEWVSSRGITDRRKAAITTDNALTMRPGFQLPEDGVSYWDPRNDATAVASTEDRAGNSTHELRGVRTSR